jgi:DNA-binding transcriptional LysR family regulator
MAIYEHRSISKAAVSLHLTQPAVSHALARLRSAFNDPLFLRDGRMMKPTGPMIAMMPLVRDAVDKLSDLPQVTPAFHIEEHERLIRIGMRDILEIPLLPELSQMLEQNRSKLQLRSKQLGLENVTAHLMANEVDIVIDAITPSHEHIISEFLFDEPFAIVVRKGHPFSQEQSIDRYLKSKHIVVSLKDSDLNLVDVALARINVRRAVAVYCEHYISGVETVLKTDLILTMPRSFAMDLQKKYAVDVLLPPIDFPAISVFLYWHERSRHDPAMSWFRTALKQIVQDRFGSKVP